MILSDVNKAKNEIWLNLEIDNEEVQKIIDSMKEGIEKGFKDFSLENEGLVESLKEEIVNCYNAGVLIKIKKFEIIWEFLIEKGYYLSPRAIHTDKKTQNKYVVISDSGWFKAEELFEIKLINRNDYRQNAISKDGTTLVNI